MSADPDPTARATDQAQRFREAVEKIRTRTDATAKALGAVGTAAITAIGYAKLADVFPLTGSRWPLVWLIVGALLMIAAVLMLVTRFQGASESIVTSADLAETIELSGFKGGEGPTEDGGILRRAYEREAKLNEVGSLAAYQARAFRFQRIAERGSTNSADLEKRAEVIFAEVLATQMRATALIVRHRAKTAVFSRWTALFIFLFVAGWYMTALSASAVQSRRTGEIEAVKRCGEAHEKNMKATLPEICNGNPPVADEPAVPKQPSPKVGSVIRVSTAALLPLRNECRARARAASEDPATACAPIEQALKETLTGG